MAGESHLSSTKLAKIIKSRCSAMKTSVTRKRSVSQLAILSGHERYGCNEVVMLIFNVKML